MPQLITQREFAAKLREELPELKDFNDTQIVNKVLELRPDLRDKVENPLSGDEVAAQEQTKMERASKSLINPETWQKHPNLREIAKGTTGTLPGIGAMTGGALATPETFGGGTVIGAGLGAGAGRGLQDLLNQALGLQETSPMQKAQNIGMDTSLTMLMPGVLTALRNPVSTARLAAGSVNNLENAILPKALRPFINSPFLENFAKGGQKIDPLTRPAWQSGIPLVKGEIANPEVIEGEIVGKTNNPIIRKALPPGQYNLPEKMPQPRIKGKFSSGYVGNKPKYILEDGVFKRIE